MNKRRRWKAKTRRRGYTGMVSLLSSATLSVWWSTSRQTPEAVYRRFLDNVRVAYRGASG